jgi:hypothetical protein
MGEHERISSISPAGVLATACMKTWTRRNTGSPSGDPQFGSTGNSREAGRAVWGVGEAHSTEEAG